MGLRVVFAEDNYLVREGTAALLGQVDDVELVATASDLGELLAAVAEHSPTSSSPTSGCRPPSRTEGIQAARMIRAEHPNIGVVVLSQYAERGYAYDLLKDGAAGLGYLLKERVADVDRAGPRARRGGAGRLGPRPEGRRGAGRRQGPDGRTRRSASLTEREREVLAQMAQGKNNAAIARSLFLTERAVEKHINSLFHKLDLTEEPDVHRRVMAVLAFLRETDHA